MHDDISDIITTAQCYAFSGATTLYSYSNSTRTTYTQIGGKWYKTATSNYNTIPSGSQCYTYAELEAINSKAEYAPIYEFIAFSLVCVCFWLFLKFVYRIFRVVYARKV